MELFCDIKIYYYVAGHKFVLGQTQGKKKTKNIEKFYFLL